MFKVILTIIFLISAAILGNYYLEFRLSQHLENLDDGDKSCIKCDLSGQNLSGRNLSGYNLTQANLMAADLRCTDLSYTNLSGANLKGANITGTILTGAILNYTNMEKVIWDDGTRCQ